MCFFFSNFALGLEGIRYYPRLSDIIRGIRGIRGVRKNTN